MGVVKCAERMLSGLVLGPAALLKLTYLFLQRQTSLLRVGTFKVRGSFVEPRERGRCNIVLRAVVGPGGGQSGGATNIYLKEIAQPLFVILGFTGNARTL